ncbi:TetR/AcrR family transcriptional regulator [Nocardiopsis changdeensis]|uniref:TetR/AcrR family transcriptional regulator n=1 Tax=Nocardiopsis changdeensis TaxID=2831969 RepID=A0ABX8BWY9_9ACTN|nr:MULTISPECIES: TetR/AcrR family transcriptional regulator [Nocardiopsis]QUX25318.1 TetR/AcrR family transcriptional regulator [Nocardiopsis changdeensis]QYX35705.1 TetR/AcrR family transcriptional regulator [Nocardiopsis sp. MT53]
MAAPTARRREKLRQATLAEIHQAARELLTDQGPAAVTINAVARRIGMSGPALYHYFASHDDLVAAVTAGFLRELTTAMRTARDARPADAAGDRLLATCRAMRHWATAHPAEFGWIFASPIPAAASARHRPDTPRNQAARDFELVFLQQIEELWARRGFPVPALEDLDPSIREQLRAYAESLGRGLPIEALHVALSCWIKLYGLLCMEVLNQLDFVYSDPGPIYEETLRDLVDTLGLDYRPPEPSELPPHAPPS